MAVQICEKWLQNKTTSLVLLGIRTRGVPLATRLAAEIALKTRQKLPLGILDITLYRDDLSRLADQPLVKSTTIPVSLESKGVCLVDDVLYTGRTIRCALDAIFDFGRPDFIGLAVLVDRGGRELPIGADVVGLPYQAKSGDNVKVSFAETDGEDKVTVEEKK